MESNIPENWPKAATVTTASRWRIKDSPGQNLRPGTTAMLIAASMLENEVVLFVSPAIGWRGTYQELQAEWESVPDTTPLTF